MQSRIQKLRISTPGRVCLFGEHQDYLQLPVIPCAISLRISLEGERTNNDRIRIELPDIQSHNEFSLKDAANYVVERDYFRSSVNVLRQVGFTFSTGFHCVVRGDIPIAAGTSSSSALVVTWINFLTQMSDQATTLTPEEIGKLAHKAEVLEFGEPGGMMDHYSTAYGGTLYLEFHPTVKIRRLNPQFKSFVLGDSAQQKDTKSILSNVKNRVLRIVKHLSRDYPGFSLYEVTKDDLAKYTRTFDREQRDLLVGTVRNRDITLEALELFQRRFLDERKFGELLNEHHAILRDVLKISTPKIDRMLDSALSAGAFGGKINGSGGGGCMFAYAPENSEVVAEAIDKIGGKSYIVHVDGGTRNEPIEEMK